MGKPHAAITGIGGYVPDYILDNEELSRMVDTNDEWIMSRVGIKTRHILKDPEKGTSFMAVEACKDLFSRKQVDLDSIEAVICTTTTPDNLFPSTASKICGALGIKKAFAYDMEAACSGFITGLSIAAGYIESGRIKRVLVISAEKLSFFVNYQDRSTCPLFGDGAAAALIDATEEEVGIQDFIIRTDGQGYPYLNLKHSGSESPVTEEHIRNRENLLFQDGRNVFKHAVTDMSQVCADIMERNQLKGEDIDWLVPHQANLRIIDAVIQRTSVDPKKVLINIEHVGNTSAASIPICLWENLDKLHKGDNVLLTAFGAGFIWGAVYLKWAY